MTFSHISLNQMEGAFQGEDHPVYIEENGII